MKKIDKEHVVFFHDGTLNGRAGAYASFRHLKDKAHYEPVDYSSLDVFQNLDISDKNVYIIGLSIAGSHLDTAFYSARSVVFIDHHPTTEKISDSLDSDNIKVLFSKERASCCLAWTYFVDNEPVPSLFLAIEDVLLDRRPRVVPNSEYICAGLGIYTDFISLASFFQNNLTRSKNSDSIAKLISEGHYFTTYIESLAVGYIDKAFYCEFLNKQVPVLNIPKTFVDPCLKTLCTKTGIAFSYVDTGNKRYWSIRTSLKTKIDAGKICVILGGGGSSHLGGFTTSTKILPEHLDSYLKDRMPKSVNMINELKIS